MKRIYTSFFFAIIALAGTAQSVSNRDYSIMLNKLLDHSVPEVGVTEMDTNESIVYLDARELNEYNVSHIKNAIWVGYDQFQKDSLANIAKNQKIVVYCSVGYRSEKVSEKLLKMGYQDVTNLYGGLFEWSNQAMPLVNDSGITKKIHAYDREWGQWVNKGQKVYEK